VPRKYRFYNSHGRTLYEELVRLELETVEALRALGYVQ
jgi:hypothetical protein